MSLALLSWTISLIVIGVRGHGPSKIVGPAEKVCLGQNSYLVSLWRVKDIRGQLKGSYICVGSILDESHILTAAHCVNNEITSNLVVRAGCVDVNDTNPTDRFVNRVFLHPGSRPEIFFRCQLNDIAILTIDPPLLMSEFISAVKLPTAEVETGQFGEIAGWGNTKLSAKPHLSKSLLKIRMKVMPSEFFPKWFPGTEFCTFDPEHERTGDSGSPFIINNTAVGILSTTTNSTNGRSCFTRVFHHLDFIQCISFFKSTSDGSKNYGSSHSGSVLNSLSQKPYMVTVWVKNRYRGRSSYVCSGVILDETHILTSAHCVQGSKWMKIKLKKYRVKCAGQAKSVVKVDIHPDYRREDSKMGEYFKNDIAVLTLIHPMTLGGAITAVKLPEVNVNSCQVGGIDRVKTGNPTNMVIVKSWDDNCGAGRHFFVTDIAENISPENFDNGNFFISNDTVVGIVSKKFHPNEGYASCTNVYFYKKFIIEKMYSNASDVGLIHEEK